MLKTRSLSVATGMILLMMSFIFGPNTFRPETGAQAAKQPEAKATTDQDTLGTPDRFWINAAKEVYRSTSDIQLQNQKELRMGLAYHKLIHGDPAIRAVALTFDDGPHPKYTPQLLAILKRYHVKATFFVVGEMAEKYPYLIREENAAGHIVGNHTYHHLNLTRMPDDEARVEWQAASDVIKSILGKAPLYCRPPGGDYDRKVITAATQTGMKTVLWTDDPGDYASPGDKTIETRVLDRIGNGGIILLHDGVQQTVDVLPQMIETLQKKGFKFQTVDEMAKDLNDPSVRHANRGTRSEYQSR